MKYIIIINIIYLYYTIISNVVKLEVKIVFIIEMFFIVSFYNAEIDFYNYKFFIFSSKYQMRLYIYIEISNSFIFDLSVLCFFSISETFKRSNAFPKSIK